PEIAMARPDRSERSRSIVLGREGAKRDATLPLPTQFPVRMPLPFASVVVAAACDDLALGGARHVVVIQDEQAALPDHVDAGARSGGQQQEVRVRVDRGR